MHIDPLVKKRLEELLAKADAIKSSRTGSRFRERTIYYVSRADVAGWTASALSLLQSALGDTAPHVLALKEAQSKFSGYESDFDALRSVVAAAHEDYVGGYLFHGRALVKAEVLDDALTQADSLLRSDFKDAACILIGVALEVALKELVQQAGLAPGKLDRMNTDLCSKNKYNMSKQKQITAWADLRNKAAHGDFGAYTKADVQDMFTGVQRFVADYLV